MSEEAESVLHKISLDNLVDACNHENFFNQEHTMDYLCKNVAKSVCDVNYINFYEILYCHIYNIPFIIVIQAIVIILCFRYTHKALDNLVLPGMDSYTHRANFQKTLASCTIYVFITSAGHIM